MYNPVGYGVFGTFGDPYGYQQVFYYGVDFEESLDLDDRAIEFYPGSELYAIKRTLVDGIYKICLCVYSIVREKNTQLRSTYVGSCIVLQDAYAEAEYIYKVLRELHENMLDKDENFTGNTLKVARAADISVREPADFVALKANAIPINKTPFFSSQVNSGKQFLVLPPPVAESSKEEQIIAFFDDGLKYYDDTGTLYFSFDNSVGEFVSGENRIDVIPWAAFLEHKSTKQQPAVVRTKKGIQKISSIESSDTAPYTEPEKLADEVSAFNVGVDEAENMVGEVATYVTPAQPYQPYPENLEDDDDMGDEDDPNRPFNLWEDPVPAGGWLAHEAQARQKEYNRLFKYTNSLLDHINGPGNKKKKKNTFSEARNKPQNKGTEEAPNPVRKKRMRMTIILIAILLLGSIAVYFLADESQAPPQAPTPAIVQEDRLDTAQEDTDTIETAMVSVPPPAKPQPEVNAEEKPQASTGQPLPAEKAPIGPQPYESEEPAVKKPDTTTMPISKKAPSGVINRIAPEDELTMPRPFKVQEPPQYPNAKELRPRPNMDLAHYNVAVLNQSGIKNKTLLELVKLLYDNVPSNIGNVYKGQETEYAAALLNSNKQLFQKSGVDYVCNADNASVLHIPAYKSPRLPVMDPK